MSKWLRIACGLAAVIVVTLGMASPVHAARPSAPESVLQDGCWRSQYGAHCETTRGSTQVILNIRYGYEPDAWSVRAEGSAGWLDGSNDGGASWTTLGSWADLRWSYYVYRACGQDWFYGYVCTPWMN